MLHYRIGKILRRFYGNFRNSAAVHVYGIGEFICIDRLLRGYLFEAEIEQSAAFRKTGAAVGCFQDNGD